MGRIPHDPDVYCTSSFSDGEIIPKFHMNRPPRTLKRLAATLTVGAVVLFAASLCTRTKVTLPRGYQVWLDSGMLALATPSGRYAELTADSWSWGLECEWQRGWREWSPFTLRPYRSGTWIQSFLWIPIAFPTVAMVGLGGFTLWWRRRPRTGRCDACGYDRSGLQATSTCPECGRTPA